MTKIPWTDVSWNPVVGCSKVSPGCDNCYAEVITQRFHRGDFNQVALHPERLDQPAKWRKPKMIFTCSMGDLFHHDVPWGYILKVFNVMDAAQTLGPDMTEPGHTFQLLTKRPGRMAHFTVSGLGRPWPSNVWAGTSVETQKYAPRLDVLARVPAKVRFVSVEPMLGPVDLRKWLEPTAIAVHGNPKGDTAKALVELGRAAFRQYGGLSWVIIGGESGPHARPMKIEWLLDLVAQCKDAGVPIFVKQDSGRLPGKQGRIPDDIWALKEFPS